MEKILVTGAVGQIGRFLIRRLLEERINFTGLDIRTAKNLPDFKLLNIQLTDRNELKKNQIDLQEFDTLIHLASKIDIEPNVIKSGKNSVELNIMGTLNLLEFMPNLQHICFTSTYLTYGQSHTNPVKEDHQTNPTTVYGASKLATEKFFQIFSEQHNIPVTILRLMGVYDLENPYSQAIPSFIKLMANNQNPTIFGNGKAKRNHLHVDDSINAILVSLKNKKNGIYNIGGFDAPSNLELVEIINKKMKKKIQPNFKNIDNIENDFVTDISKAKNELGFNPIIGIEEGILKTISRFRKNPW